MIITNGSNHVPNNVSAPPQPGRQVPRTGAPLTSLCGVVLSALMLTSCSAHQTASNLREQEVDHLMREILTSQEGPKSQAMKEKALTDYEQFVHSSLDIQASRSEAMADAAQRLADLYMDMEPRVDHTKSRSLYERVLTLYPKRPRNDAILYQLAHGYAEEKKNDLERRQLERLVKEYPESGFAQEAHFRLAEHLYDEDRLEAATHAYRQVLRRQDLLFFEKALYKLGWTLFQIKQYGESADNFLSYLDQKGFRVTPGGQAADVNLPAAEMDTVWEVANTVILVFDYMGGASAVEEYFKTRGDHRFETYVYRRLGDVYMQMGRFKEAADIYEAFNHSNPLHEDAPYFQAQVIEAYTRGNFIDLAHEARITLVERYREGGAWFKANAGESKKKARALVLLHREQVRESMYELALYHHARAQSSHRKEDYQTSLSWEKRFLDTFSEDPRTHSIRFLLAEGLYDSGDYLASMEGYHQVAYLETQTPSCDSSCQKIRTEGGYGALHALEKIVKGTEGKVRRDDPFVRRWLSESQRFMQTFPADPRIPEVLLNAAEVHFQLQEFETARGMIQQVLAMKTVDDKTRYFAQRLSADSFLEEEAYLRTEEEIRKAIALIPKGREKDRPVLEKALSSSIYKQGETLKDEGRLAESAQMFLRVAAETPASSVAPVALFDAGTLFVKIGEKDKAIAAYQLLAQKYPGSPYAETSLLQWAELLRDQEDYQAAAPTYERASALSVRDPRTAQETAFLAGVMYEKASDWGNALRVFLRYKTLYPEGDRVIEAAFKAAEASNRLQDKTRARALYEDVIVLQKKMRTPTPDVMAAAARAQYWIAEVLKAQFEEVSLVSPLDKNLERKKALLKESLEGFTAAARYRISDITTASAYQMGELLEHFRDALLTSERPGNLNADQLEQYTFLLEEQAYPFEEKAIAAYDGNVRRAQESGLYDRWIQASYRRLADLLPVRFRRVEQGERFTGEVNADSLLQVQIPSVLNSAGIYFRETGAFSKAEAAYQQALRLDARYPEALFNLGVLYELYLNKPGAALANYKAYLQILKSQLTIQSRSPGEELGLPPGASPDLGSSEKEKIAQQVALWVAALEKQLGGTP